MQSTKTEKVVLPVYSNLLSAESKVDRIPLLSRIYVWSIILEPLLFFVLFERSTTGVTGNLSRILQLVVLIGLTLSFLAAFLNSRPAGVRLPNFASPLYIYYGIYFSITIVAGFIGFLSGAYNLPVAYDNNKSGFSQWLNSAEFRPIFEYITALYYFIYFIVLPKYLLKTEKSLEYYFSVFRKLFIISFIVGAIDLGFAIFGVGLVPRHFADGVMVGPRFHGLAGEPRDAFVYLFFGLAMLHLHAHYKGLALNKGWVVAITVAATLTQSVSGLLGIVFFLSLYSVYSLGKSSIRQIFRICIALTLITLTLYVITVNSERTMLYLASTSNLWITLETGGEIPYPISVQMGNVYPLYDLTVKFFNFNILPILIGSGLGSASVINNIYNTYTTVGMNNPNSQLVRLVFESGVIGTGFFIMSFTHPIRRLTKHLPTIKQHEFMLLMLLLLGCLFGHRSTTIFIYLGVFIATSRILDHRAGLGH